MSWSADSKTQQSDLAAAMLNKGASVNMIEFEPGTVLPDDGKGGEHMYSFDNAYKIPLVSEWLFSHKK